LLKSNNYFLNSIVVTNISFFISNSFVKLNTFYKIHEFFNIEEINESLLDITSNFKFLRFEFMPDSFEKKCFFAVLNCSEKGNYLNKDLVIPSELTITNPNGYLLSKISSKICLKILVKLEMWLRLYL
jgi:DNA-directed RNA polymerase alpha subunit